ncbi:ADAMTS3 [Cervus elaphus hippelaphus]|uniref:ADAMTS3 n=1 Tax=Cervus elaphus hippelaphus TaxID=46360 RepID=A0A212D5U6_CEREH|nr:ADAMTS3 [Cervus elaphus hippelaphus]
MVQIDLPIKRQREYELVTPVSTNSEGHYLSHILSANHKKRSARDVSSSSERLFFNITAFGRDFHLRLKPNTQLIAPGAVVEWHEASPVPGNITDPIHAHQPGRTSERIWKTEPLQTDCAYVGDVMDIPGTSVAISNCDGLTEPQICDSSEEQKGSQHRPIFAQTPRALASRWYNSHPYVLDQESSSLQENVGGLSCRLTVTIKAMCTQENYVDSALLLEKSPSDVERPQVIGTNIKLSLARIVFQSGSPPTVGKSSCDIPVTSFSQQESVHEECQISSYRSIHSYDCLLDDPFEHDWPKLPELPGINYSMDEQCRFDFGVGYKMCTAWCYKGHCMWKNANQQKQDGNWGSWTKFGSCSRTCGTGVRFRTRQCNNPTWAAEEWEHCTKTCGASGYQLRTVRCLQPLHDGTNRSVNSKYCPGERPESRRPCNRLPCPAQWKTGPWNESSKYPEDMKRDSTW